MAETVRSGESFPSWCELRAFSQIRVGPDRETRIEVGQRRARLLATAGSLQVRQGGRSQVLREQQFVELEPGGAVLFSTGAAEAMLLEGTWGDELGGCGVFRAENVAAPSDRGDPVDYPKNTNIDAHYHDCDEYWILLEGRATAVVDSEAIGMRPGECLLIPMGAMHDMPDAPEPVRAIYFEASLRGRKRIGHLWQHTHGPARPEGHSP